MAAGFPQEPGARQSRDPHRRRSSPTSCGSLASRSRPASPPRAWSACFAAARPGPVVALRSDMDALPVTEQGDLPFKSTAKAMWNGQETGVMHACGHDNHMAILLGTATALARMKDRLPGTVKVIFQPAEEGPPPGETGGAEQMVKESVLENPKVDAMFGLHVFPYPAGDIVYRSGPMMASADSFLDQGQGPADARRGAVGRRRSDRRRLADRDGPADDHQPHRQHHRSAGGGDGRPLHRRQPLEHRARRRRARRDDSRVRRERAQGHPASRSRRSRRNIAESAGATATVDVRARLSGDAQRSGVDRTHAADAAARRWRGEGPCSVR